MEDNQKTFPQLVEKCSNQWKQRSISTTFDNVVVHGESADGANNHIWNQDNINHYGFVVHGVSADGPNHQWNKGNINNYNRVDNKKLPPGFRFCPLDGELVVHYLRKRIKNEPLPHDSIKDVNLYQSNPYELSENYEPVDDKAWYFFTPRDRKYRNGSRPNRAAEAGYWKATGAAKPVRYKGERVGFKRALVFYRGKPRQGNKDNKTNWMMHEYGANEPPRARKDASDMRLDDWVLCKIYQNEDKRQGEAKQQQPVVLDEGTPMMALQDFNEFPGPSEPVNAYGGHIHQPGFPSDHHVMDASEGRLLEQLFMDEHIIRPPFSSGDIKFPVQAPSDHHHLMAASEGSFQQQPPFMDEDIIRPPSSPGDIASRFEGIWMARGFQEFIRHYSVESDGPSSTSFVDQYLNLDNIVSDNHFPDDLLTTVGDKLPNHGPCIVSDNSSDDACS